MSPLALGDVAYRNTRWTTANNLPDNKIQCLHQSSNGYLWVGTSSGLARFDGHRFTVIGKDFEPAHADPGINAIVEDETDNSLWFGTTAGLFRLRDHELDSFPVSEEARKNKVWGLLSLSKGDLLAQTESGLGRLRNGKFALIDLARQAIVPDNGVKWLVRAPDHQVWLGHGNWQRQYDPSTDLFAPLPVAGFPTNVNTRAVLLDRATNLWAGTENGLFRENNRQWKRFDQRNGLGDAFVHFIFQDSMGQIWICTKHTGLHRLDGDRFLPVSLDVSQAEFAVDGITEDHEGNLWVATREGLRRLQRPQVQTLTKADGLENDRVNTVYAAPDRSIWIGSLGGLSWVREGSIGHYTHPFPTSQNDVRGMCMDEAGTLWFGALGLYKFPPGGPQGLLEALTVYSLHTDRNGVIWAGTEEGIVRYINQMPQWLRFDAGINNSAKLFFHDRAGDMWFGGDRGLHQYHENKVTTFTSRDGLAGDRVYALHQDSDGTFWIGTDGGLTRFHQGRLFSFTTSQGLPENNIHQILEDDSKHFWISGLRGIHRVARQDLTAVAGKRQATAHFITFSETDGMLSSETSGGIQPAGCRSDDGRLWFPTIKGVAIINPKTIKINKVPPPVVIEQVKADGELIFKSVTFSAGIRKLVSSSGKSSLARDERSEAARAGSDHQFATSFEFRYTANTLVSPERVRFRYFLEGHDKSWREVDSSERTAYYTNLRPSHYTFRVKACNNHGYWNETGAKFDIAVEPRFMQTIWFPFSLVSAFIALVWWRFRWQHRVLAARETASLERERARIARDLHDDLGTNLTGIALQADIALRKLHDPSALETQLNHMARTSRALVDQMREIVWAANPQCDTLESFIRYIGQFAENFLGAAALRCRLDFPDVPQTLELRAEVRHALFLVVKEALHNIVKHAAASEVRLCVKVDGESLILEIEDNGRGSPAALSSLHSNGVTNMRQRIEAVGGKFHWNSHLGAGTWVRIQMKVEKCAGTKS